MMNTNNIFKAKMIIVRSNNGVMRQQIVKIEIELFFINEVFSLSSVSFDP